MIEEIKPTRVIRGQKNNLDLPTKKQALKKSKNYTKQLHEQPAKFIIKRRKRKRKNERRERVAPTPLEKC